MGIYVDASDLLAVTSQACIDRYFDDDGNGSADPDLVAGACSNASNYAETKLIKGWPLPSIRQLLLDPIAKMHLAWVAFHFGARRKPEWRDEQGRAPFWQEFAQATKYFDDMSKGEDRNAHENTAGVHPAIGGHQITPGPQQSAYVFAPDPNRGVYRRPGGY